MKEDVSQALEAWLIVLGLPPRPGPDEKDLRGKFVRVAKFQDEDTVRFFFPRRTLIFQQRMVRDLGRMIRKRGGKVESVHLTVEDYERWRAKAQQPDGAEVRYRFASAPPEF